MQTESDKEYTDKRAAMIPEAEAEANQTARNGDEWNRAFHAGMQRRAYAAGLLSYDPDALPMRPIVRVSGVQSKATLHSAQTDRIAGVR